MSELIRPYVEVDNNASVHINRTLTSLSALASPHRVDNAPVISDFLREGTQEGNEWVWNKTILALVHEPYLFLNSLQLYSNKNRRLDSFRSLIKISGRIFLNH